MLTCARPALGKSSPSARTPGKPPPFSRTTAAIARAISTSSVARFTLNAISGRRAPTMTPPARSSSSRRTVVRAKLARVDAALELLRTPAPVERGPSLRRRVAVEEHRQAELGADPIREPQRAIPRPFAIARIECDDRHDVCRADSGMSAFVAAEVDPVARTGDSRQQCLDE